MQTAGMEITLAWSMWHKAPDVMINGLSISYHLLHPFQVAHGSRTDKRCSNRPERKYSDLHATACGAPCLGVSICTAQNDSTGSNLSPLSPEDVVKLTLTSHLHFVHFLTPQTPPPQHHSLPLRVWSCTSVMSVETERKILQKSCCFLRQS